MDFRFPHPFENIKDAFKDALDPGTSEDGSLVTQLMNENNRAVEDRLTEIVTGEFYADTFTSGANAGTSYLFNPLVTLEYARWSVSIAVQVLVDTSGTWSDYITLSLAGSDILHSSSTGGVTGSSSIGAADTLSYECLGGPIGLLCGVRPLTPAGTVPASPVSTFDVAICANRLS